MTDSNRVSVITVSYNEADTIRKTIESVLYQTYAYIEYIIIDGNSTDETYQIICEYDKKFRERNIPYIHMSEPDNGIYDAMNKGLNYCSGEWVYYLNANDRLFQDSTLEQVFSQKYIDEVSCIYGNTWNVKGKRLYFKRAYGIETIYYKVPFIHQALFVRRRVIDKYKFDVSYKISADYDLFVKMYVNGEQYMQIDCDIAFFDLSGVSQIVENSQKELIGIRKKYGLNRKFRLKYFLWNYIVPSIKKSKGLYGAYMYYMSLPRGEK